MKIYRIAADALLAASRRWERETDISLKERCSWGGEIFSLDINWAAIGSVSPEKAQAFAEALQTAVKIAESVNREGYQVSWDRSAKVADMTTREEYDAAVLEIYDNLKNCRPARIVRWLDAHCYE